jgi:hypothetical protein
MATKIVAVQADLGDSTLETVASRYAEARDLATALSMRPVVARCHLGLGRFLRRRGRTGSGQEQLEIAARLFAELGLGSLDGNPVVYRQVDSLDRQE